MASIALLSLLLAGSETFAKPNDELGKPLNEAKTVFLDKDGGRVWLKTRVSRQTGVLEMFLCRQGTKEHESVVAVNSPAFVIHAGLLALGLEPGQPARFDPEFQPPKGPKLDIIAHWRDANGDAKSRPAAEWMRRVTQRWYATPIADEVAADVEVPEDLDLRYIPEDGELIFFGPINAAVKKRLVALSPKPEWATAIGKLEQQTTIKPFTGKWVFAGSGFWVDEETKDKHYLAESGNVICVANFGDAMIDIDVESSAENDSLLYEPWTERVPPVGTPVLIEIRPASAKAE